MKEFKINKYLTLKLEKGKTNIYVKGELFLQCKHLLMNINIEKNNSYNEIKSIDDAIKELPEGLEISVPPEVEFWGHCSNIQTWVEYDYDTRLLEMKLAFPLLKALTDAGHQRARTRLSEEVLKRFNEGNENVREYLIFENFFGYLKPYDKFYHLLNEEDATLLIEITAKYNQEVKVETFIPLEPRREECYIVIRGKKIVQMGLWLDEYCKKIPSEISKLKHLTRLRIFTKKFNFDTSNVVFKYIEHLSFYIKKNKATEFYINNIELFPNLKSIVIYSDKELTNPKIIIPDSVGKLKNLEFLLIKYLNIKKFPESLYQNFLRWLIIYHSNLKYLPEDLFALNSLEVVNLIGTDLQFIPSSILNNRSIKYFACEPYLMSAEITEWIKKEKLQPFKEKTFKKKKFFDFPVVT